MKLSRREFVAVLGAAAAMLRLGTAGAASPPPAAGEDAATGDSLAERLRLLRHCYIDARGNPRERFAVNAEMVAIAMQMRAAGVRSGEVRRLTHASLRIATREARRAGNPRATGLYFS